MSKLKFKSKKLRLKFNNNTELKLFILNVTKFFGDHDVDLSSSINVVDINLIGGKELIESVSRKIEEFAQDIILSSKVNPNEERIITAKLLQTLTKGALNLQFFIETLNIMNIPSKLNGDSLITKGSLDEITNIYRHTYKKLQNTPKFYSIDVRRFITLLQMNYNLSDSVIINTAVENGIIHVNEVDDNIMQLKFNLETSIDKFSKIYSSGLLFENEEIDIQPFFDGGKIVFNNKIHADEEE
jgi:hypothetical protein